MHIVILLIWIGLAVFKLNYPTFSVEELKYVPSLITRILNPELFWILRLINISVAFFYLLSMAKKYRPFGGILLLITAPWLFILAREYNLYVASILLCLTILSQDKGPKYIRYCTYGLLLVVFLPLLFSLSPNYLIEKIMIFKSQFDLTNLFFQMENNSFYFHIPKIGYYLIPTLPLFLLGITRTLPNRRFFILAVVALLVYFLYQTSHFIFGGIGFLFLFQNMILDGFEKIKKNYVLSLAIIFFTLFNFIFFLESYFRHYQIKYGFERSYAEYELTRKIIDLSPRQVYLIKNDKVQRLLAVYSYHRKLPPIEFVLGERELLELKSKCMNAEILCVVDQDQLKSIFPEVDKDKLESVGNADGLKVYYLL